MRVKHSNMSKLLSVFLSAVMLLTVISTGIIIPGASLEAEAATTGATYSAGSVADINTYIGYANSAGANVITTIKLSQDISVGETAALTTITGYVLFDFNGHSLIFSYSVNTSTRDDSYEYQLPSENQGVSHINEDYINKAMFNVDTSGTMQIINTSATAATMKAYTRIRVDTGGNGFSSKKYWSATSSNLIYSLGTVIVGDKTNSGYNNFTLTANAISTNEREDGSSTGYDKQRCTANAYTVTLNSTSAKLMMYGGTVYAAAYARGNHGGELAVRCYPVNIQSCYSAEIYGGTISIASDHSMGIVNSDNTNTDSGLSYFAPIRSNAPNVYIFDVDSTLTLYVGSDTKKATVNAANVFSTSEATAPYIYGGNFTNSATRSSADNGTLNVYTALGSYKLAINGTITPSTPFGSNNTATSMYLYTLFYFGDTNTENGIYPWSYGTFRDYVAAHTSSNDAYFATSATHMNDGGNYTAATTNLYRRNGYTQVGFSGATSPGATPSSSTTSTSAAGYNATNGGSLYLYPNWSINTYSISYDLAGGTATASMPASYQITSSSTLGAPVRNGYTFNGWLLTNVTYPATDTMQPWTVGNTYLSTTSLNGKNGNISLQAQWTKNPYNITFDLNGGTYNGSTSNVVTPYDVETPISIPAGLTKAYYTFNNKWQVTTADGNWTLGTQHNAGDNTFSGAYGNATLKALFTPITYTAAYDSAFGSEVTDPNVLSYTVESTNSLPMVTRTGYIFLGWKPVATSGSWMSGTVYPAGTSLTGKNGNVSFVAQWESAVYNVSLSLAAGETISGNTSLNYAYASTLNLNNPSKTGYTFTGWSVKAVSGDGVTWTVGTVYNVDAVLGYVTLPANMIGNVTLEPVWSVNTYTVTFNANGGSAVSSFTYTIEDTVTIPTSTYNGYSFAGWSVSSNSGNWTAANYAAGASLNSMYGNVTLKANWSTVNYTVTLVTDGDTVSPSTLGYSINALTTLPLPTKTGYTFTGWKVTAKTGSWVTNTVYTDTLPAGSWGNVTLTAQWAHTAYTITLFSDGTQSYTSKTYYIDDTSFRLPESTLAGYSFLYWQVANTSGAWTKDEKIYINTDISNRYGSVTLNAVFDTIDYTITYKADGAVIGTEGYTIEDSIGINSYSKNGYSFGGWRVASTAGNWHVDGIVNSGELSANYYYGDVVLEAVLTPINYTATLVPNGGAALGNISFTTESTAVLPTPVRTGYDFAGWKVTSATSGSWINGEILPTGTSLTGKYGNVTLTAQWTPTTYTVMYGETDGRNKNMFIAPSVLNSDWTLIADGTYSKSVSGLTVTFDPVAETFTINGTCTGQSGPYTDCRFIELFDFNVAGTSSDGSYTVTSLYESGSRPILSAPGNDSTLPVVYLFRNGTAFSYPDVAVDAETPIFTRTGTTTTGGVITGKFMVYDVYNADRTFDNFTFKVKVEEGSSYTGYSQLANSYTIESALTLASPLKNGYSFLNWTVGQTTGSWTEGAVYGAGSVLTNNYGNITLLASYAPLEYHISYNANGGSIPAADAYTTESGFTAPTSTKTAYTFAYWEVAEKSGSWAVGDRIYTGDNFNGSYGNLSLSAVWTPVDYTVTFNTDGGNAVAPMTYNTESTSLLPTPVKNGYSFSGWTVSTADGSWEQNAAFSAGTALTGKYGNVTLTASWSLNSYTVTFNTDGGEAIYNKIYTTVMTDTLPTPVKTGYDFTGWTVITGAGSWTVGASFAAGVAYAGKYGDVTLKASWQIKTFNITWVVDGISTVETYNYGATPSFSGSTAKAANVQYTYTFAGWSPEIATVTAAAVYTAEYTSTVNTYTVTWIIYEDDSSSPTTSTEVYEYGETPVYNNGVNPTRASSDENDHFWRFTGWSPEITAVTGAASYTAQYAEVTNPSVVTWVIDGVSNTDRWAAGETPSYYTTPVKAADGMYEYTFTGWSPAIVPCVSGTNYTYTASFSASPIDYSVTLDANGGSVSTTSIAYNYTTASFNLPVPVRNGYQFAGWRVNSTEGNWNSGDIYNSSAAIASKYGNVTLTAQWTAISYTATLNLYGSVSDSVSFTSESGTVIPVPVRNGYTFINWTVTAGAGNWTVNEAVGKADSLNGKYGDVALSANWTPVSYVLTFDTDGGNAFSAMSYNIESSDTLETPVKTGYTFTGWTVTAASGSWNMGMAVADGASLSGTYGNATLKANWQIRSYTLTWIDNGGTAEETYNYNAPVTTRTPTAKGGYTCVWDKAVPALMPDENVVITAIYTPNSYTAVLDADGGVINGTDTANYTPKTTLTLPTATKTGYTFMGWAPVAETGSWSNAASPYAAGDYTEVWGNVTLKAVWTPTAYTLTFETNGGAAIGNMSYTLISGEVLPTPVKTGYTFNGWTVALGEGTWQQGTTVSAGALLTGRYGNATLQASWQINTYTISWVCGEETLYSYVEYGEAILPYEPLTRVGYTAAWDLTVPAVMPAEDLVFTAVYTPVSYYARINVNGGTAVDSFYYNTESTDTLATPTRDGCTFNGWLVTTAAGNWVKNSVVAGGTALTGKYGNVTLTAQWIIETHTVTWVTGDTSKVTTWYYGATPSYDGIPVKAPDAQYSYVFTGWDKDIAVVTENAVYTALFDRTQRVYSVVWNVDGAETAETYHFGDTPVFPGAEPVRLSTEDYDFTFAGWSPEITAVSSDSVYTAQFNVFTKLRGLSLDSSAEFIETEGDVQLNATIYPATASVSDVVWTSSDTSVATVDATGKVTAVTSGVAVIKVSSIDGSFTACSVVTVKARTVQYVLVSSHGVSTTSLSGTAIQLYATVMPDNAANTSIVWSSTDSSVASVDENGLVTFKRVGEATIKAVSADGYAAGSIDVKTTADESEVKDETKTYTVMYQSNGNVRYIIEGTSYDAISIRYPAGTDVTFTISNNAFNVFLNGVKLEAGEGGVYTIEALDRDRLVSLAKIETGLPDSGGDSASGFLAKIQAFFRAIVEFFRNLFK